MMSKKTVKECMVFAFVINNYYGVARVPAESQYLVMYCLGKGVGFRYP